MSNLEPYVVGNDGVVQNNNNSAAQSSQNSVGLFSNMRFSYSTTDGAAVYKPVMPPTSPHAVSPTRQPAYHACGDGGGDGSAMAAAPPNVNASSVQQTKRKRGRPRKYLLDGAMTSPLPVPLPQPEGVFPPSGFSSLEAAAAPSSGKKSRGRPPGSGRKQQVSNMGLTGVGFTPHVITVKAGEDVSSKIVSFSQNGSRAICILSANGAISNVTLRQAATSGGTVTYEGRFEILSLSGSYMLLENGGQRSRTGGLSVLLAGPDGRVLGGGVAGVLTAAAPVQVVVGCFIQGQEESNPPNQADPSPAPANFVPGASSGGTPSESSGGPGSPLNQSTEVCNDINLQGNPTFSWQ